MLLVSALVRRLEPRRDASNACPETLKTHADADRVTLDICAASARGRTDIRDSVQLVQ